MQVVDNLISLYTFYRIHYNKYSNNSYKLLRKVGECICQ